MVYEQKTLSYQGKIVFEKIAVSTFDRMPKIFQDNEACFMFITNGGFKIRTPDKVLVFNEGDAMLSKCHNFFFEKGHCSVKKQNDRIEAIGVLLHPSIIKELFDIDKINSSKFKVSFNMRKINIDKLLFNFMDSIDFLLDNPTVADNGLILTKLKEFIILLTKTNSAPSIYDFISSLLKPYEYNFKSIVEKNIFSNLSLVEFSQLCNMSLSTFKRHFKGVYSESPHKYITRKKIDKACEMLSIKENRISDIIYDCGFETNSTFNRAFKLYQKISPSEYRLNLFA